MKNIVLIGFMGTGKTSTGRALAARLGCGFADLDQYIEEKEGRKISDIFAKEGEKYFRAREREAALEFAKRKNLVLATGGGTFLDPKNRDALSENGVVVCLYASAESIAARTGGDDTRPLLAKEGDRIREIEKMMAARREIYECADFTVDTGELSPMESVEEIVGFLRREGVLRG